MIHRNWSMLTATAAISACVIGSVVAFNFFFLQKADEVDVEIDPNDIELTEVVIIRLLAADFLVTSEDRFTKSAPSKTQMATSSK